jgi:hypothetical protein
MAANLAPLLSESSRNLFWLEIEENIGFFTKSKAIHAFYRSAG